MIKVTGAKTKMPQTIVPQADADDKASFD